MIRRLRVAGLSLVWLLECVACSERGVDSEGSRVASNKSTRDEKVAVAEAALSSGPTVPGFVLFAGNSLRIQSSTIVLGGDVGARGTTGPFLTSGFALSVGQASNVDVLHAVFGDSVQLGSRAVVGAVKTNRLQDLGATHGSVSALVPLPPLPGTMQVKPGTAALNVSGVQTISSGAFGAVTVSGQLILKGGTYQFASLQLNDFASIQALDVVKVLIAGRLSAGKSAKILAPLLLASKVRIEVSGIDGAGGTLGASPVAASFGQDSSVQALMLVPNGTLSFAKDVTAVGAFTANDIDVGPLSHVTWQTGITSTCPISCDDANPCTTDACGSNGTCTHVAVTNGSSCDDGNLCTLADTCQAGICVGGNQLACSSVPHCATAGTCNRATGLCSSVAASVGSDLRMGTPDQIRLAAARLANACRAQMTVPMGAVVSGAMMVALGTAAGPQVWASGLACALNAAPGTTCSALTACTEGSLVPPSQVAICDGPVLVTKNAAGDVLRAVCSDFGGTCYNTDMGSMCGVATCDPGETYSCDGRALVACTHGVRTRTPCGPGQVCGTRSDGILDCVGSGPACSGAGRCSAGKAINCVKEVRDSGHEASLDCGALGLSCGVDATGQARCQPGTGSCKSLTDPAYCVGSDLNVCVMNQWWRVSCASVGATGRCVPGIGASGEAGCL
jgi:hypothetical protein